jgi:hypothetical protein
VAPWTWRHVWVPESACSSWMLTTPAWTSRPWMAMAWWAIGVHAGREPAQERHLTPSGACSGTTRRRVLHGQPPSG